LPAFDDIIDANQTYAAGFDAGDLAAQPRLRLAILTCMDCRIDTAAIFGLVAGDAHILRNAGARASDDAIRSLIKSVHQLDVERIAVVHHTDCGAAKIELGQLRATVEANTGRSPDEIDFRLIGDPDQTLLDDVERLRTDAYLPPGTQLAGFMYDVHTGRLDPRVETEVS